MSAILDRIRYMSREKHLRSGSKFNQAVKALLGTDQGIKVASKLLKSMNQERAAAI